jgi:hypothetical protein
MTKETDLSSVAKAREILAQRHRKLGGMVEQTTEIRGKIETFPE